MLTQQELMRNLHYDPASGIFVRIATASPNAQMGTIAGSVKQNGYRRINVRYASHAAHRLAFLYMTGEFPPEVVDHINGIRDDNSWANLRAISQAENQRNRCLPKSNTSGACGVYWKKPRRRWEASIIVNQVTRFLGHFPTKAEAIAARKLAEVQYGFSERCHSPRLRGVAQSARAA
jgi:hypothetical protein